MLIILTIIDNEKAIVFQSYHFKTFQLHNDILIPQHIEHVKIYLDSTLSHARPEKYCTPNEVKNMITKYS